MDRDLSVTPMWSEHNPPQRDWHFLLGFKGSKVMKRGEAKLEKCVIVGLTKVPHNF